MTDLVDVVASAHGRALAMFRPGSLQASAPTGFANGEGVGLGSAGRLLFRAPSLVAKVSGVASGSVGSLSFHPPLGDANGSGVANLTPADVSLRFSPAKIAVPGDGQGHPGSLLIRLAIHRFGSSMAGASTLAIQRVSPTQVVTEYDSQGPTNSDVIAAYPILWLDAMVSNSGASTLYVMFFDTTTVPTNGTLPVRQPVQVGAGGQTFIDIGSPGSDGLSGRPTKNGLCWAASTTSTTLTVDTGSSMWCTARTVAIGS